MLTVVHGSTVINSSTPPTPTPLCWQAPGSDRPPHPGAGEPPGVPAPRPADQGHGGAQGTPPAQLPASGTASTAPPCPHVAPPLTTHSPLPETRFGPAASIFNNVQTSISSAMMQKSLQTHIGEQKVQSYECSGCLFCPIKSDESMLLPRIAGQITDSFAQ